MRIAIPVADGQLCSHFGHCEQFTIVDCDTASRTVQEVHIIAPPAHATGVFPKWLRDQGVHMVIVGGIGEKARLMFEGYGIKILQGIAPDNPEVVVKAYLEGSLEAGENGCDHSGHGSHGCNH